MTDLQAIKQFLIQLIQPIVEDSVRRAFQHYHRQKKAIDDDKPMDIKAASDFLGLKPPTIYEKTSRNEIPHFKRGKKLFFLKRDLMKWLEEGRRKTGKEYNAEIQEYLKRRGGAI